MMSHFDLNKSLCGYWLFNYLLIWKHPIQFTRKHHSNYNLQNHSADYLRCKVSELQQHHELRWLKTLENFFSAQSSSVKRSRRAFTQCASIT